MPRVTDDHLAARRRQILDGARRCFAKYGYESATVRRLEETIGLSRGAIFHHFKDKDTLFFELAREDAERMAEVAAREGLIQVMRDLLPHPNSTTGWPRGWRSRENSATIPIFTAVGPSVLPNSPQRPPSA